MLVVGVDSSVEEVVGAALVVRQMQLSTGLSIGRTTVEVAALRLRRLKAFAELYYSLDN